MIYINFKNNLHLFSFLLYRLSSVICVQTAYVPDEYWQSLEVAHNMVFGYGYLTWEWRHGLRSYIYPMFFAILYRLLQYYKLDYPATLIYIPRIAQAVLTAVSDYYFLLICNKFQYSKYWTITFILTNWFSYYCGSRTILNTFETSLTIIALYYYPWTITKHKYSYNSIKSNSIKYLIIAAVTCIIRPTAVTIWLPLVLYQLIKLYPDHVTNFIFKICIPISVFISITSICIDYTFYKKFVFPPYNFLMINIFSGIASFYGSHSTVWYFTQGIPTVLGLHVVPFVLGINTVLRNWGHCIIERILLGIIVINVVIFSLIPHKEFRFILPLVPMMEMIAIKYMSDMTKFREKKQLITLLLAVGFMIPAGLFGFYHQKGTLSVMNYLSNEVYNQRGNASILFLTPCHATPLYSHLHVNVPVRFLTCDPPIMESYWDESDEFFRAPVVWLEKNWDELDRFTYIVCFDALEGDIDSYVKRKGFALKERFVHTVLKGSSQGDSIIVYSR